MNLFRTLRQIATTATGRVSAARFRRQTRMDIESLSPHIQSAISKLLARDNHLGH